MPGNQPRGSAERQYDRRSADVRREFANRQADRIVDDILASRRRADRVPLCCRCDSVSIAMRCMQATASTGYFPTAVSPESMTASVPSKIALQRRSLRPALRGFSRIESSMSVR